MVLGLRAAPRPCRRGVGLLRLRMGGAFGVKLDGGTGIPSRKHCLRDVDALSRRLRP